MYWFALASLSPVVIIATACLVGGSWTYAAFAYVTLFVMLMDRMFQHSLPTRSDASAERFALSLSVLLGLLHFAVLTMAVVALSGASYLNVGQSIFLALAVGLYLGQVSNSNAHELIHRPGRFSRRLGIAVYASMLFGHHASAHPKVHHIHVASDEDPNSARKGERFYRFWPRAWLGSFKAGWRAENFARSRRAEPATALSHPYFAYFCGAAVTMMAAYSIAGWRGLALLIALAAYAQMQLILADYIQHYGLRRLTLDNGKLEPAGPHHSWNAPHWYSSAMMLNAPRHSDHHLHPFRTFPALQLDTETMPTWPYSMPVMATLALFPGLWRRVMDPRVAQWHERRKHRAGQVGTKDRDINTADLPL